VDGGDVLDDQPPADAVRGGGVPVVEDALSLLVPDARAVVVDAEPAVGQQPDTDGDSLAAAVERVR
jgi:hypothetical protein